MIDKPGEACGVFGAFTPGADAARLTYFGLFALQHRGQESAGIAVSDKETITVLKELGLVAQIFNETSLEALEGDLAIGHTRYSTTGSSVWENSQPIYRPIGRNGIAVSHNGNLTNTETLREKTGKLFTTTDSELIVERIACEMESKKTEIATAMSQVLPEIEGAFSLAVMDRTTLVGVRDPHGFRPLCLGRLENGWILASETAALDILGSEFVRELDPGEMIVIDDTGITSLRPFAETSQSFCLFEFVYFARPDSILYGQNIHAARRRMGEELARQSPVDADIVVPVPESGIPAAQGYATVSRIPYSDGLVKNRYVGRTFIEPAQSMRDRGIKMKLNAMPGELASKKVVLVDDSIVRGSTTKQLISMVRESGATEVHLRISSPPYRWPCFYGMDTSDPTTLLAADRTIDEIQQFLGVDSLAYLDLERLITATGVDNDVFCSACLSGTYPTEAPLTIDKYLLERP